MNLSLWQERALWFCFGVIFSLGGVAVIYLTGPRPEPPHECADAGARAFFRLLNIRAALGPFGTILASH